MNEISRFYNSKGFYKAKTWKKKSLQIKNFFL